MPAHTISRRTALKTLGAAASSAAVVPWLSDEGPLAFALKEWMKSGDF